MIFGSFLRTRVSTRSANSSTLFSGKPKRFCTSAGGGNVFHICQWHGSAELLGPTFRESMCHFVVPSPTAQIAIYVPGPGTEGPPSTPMVSAPPPPSNLGEEDFPSSFLLLSLLPSFFPSSFLLSLLPFSFLSPFFLSSFPPSFEAMSAAHHHHRGEEMLCDTFAIK